jgi:hypothetical protein
MLSIETATLIGLVHRGGASGGDLAVADLPLRAADFPAATGSATVRFALRLVTTATGKLAHSG